MTDRAELIARLVDAFTELHRVWDEAIAALEAKPEPTECTIGVGTGGGNLFVHGTYESVKRVQEIILENERLRNQREEPAKPEPKAAMRCCTSCGYEMSPHQWSNHTSCPKCCTPVENEPAKPLPESVGEWLDAEEVQNLKRIADFWEETAGQFCCNADFYRGLLDKCATHLGEEVYICDDGSRSDEPLRLKIPDAIANSIKAARADERAKVLKSVSRA